MAEMPRWTVKEDIFMLYHLCQQLSQKECSNQLNVKFNLDRSESGFSARKSLLKKTYPQIWDAELKSWKVERVYRLFLDWTHIQKVSLQDVVELTGSANS